MTGRDLQRRYFRHRPIEANLLDSPASQRACCGVCGPHTAIRGSLVLTWSCGRSALKIVSYASSANPSAARLSCGHFLQVGDAERSVCRNSIDSMA